MHVSSKGFGILSHSPLTFLFLSSQLVLLLLAYFGPYWSMFSKTKPSLLELKRIFFLFYVIYSYLFHIIDIIDLETKLD